MGVFNLRERQKRNMLATLLLSQGTPMLPGGDEFGRTQKGNNNAYCQDSDIGAAKNPIVRANGMKPPGIRLRPSRWRLRGFWMLTVSA